MKRRKFIQIAAAGTLAAALPAVTWASDGETALRALATPRIRDLLGDKQALSIGEAYCATCRSESTAGELSRVLLSDTGLSLSSPTNKIRGRLERQVQQDFQRGNTIRVQGWILSRTEARQAALYSILSS